MKVSIVQKNILWGDVRANTASFENLILNTPQKAELYVLPEMFTTGFATPDGATVEKQPSEGLRWMQSLSERTGAAVVGSIALQPEDSSKCVNRMYFVTPDGNIAGYYDKRHLFAYGGEDIRFERGERRVVVEYGGVRFLLAVCYDLRFPVWLRCKGDYDAVIVCANWPVQRRLSWDVLVRARAMENEAYVLACNRTGSDPVCEYNGGSAVINPYGETLSSLPKGEEGLCFAELDTASLGAYRRNFPVLKDADAFSLL